MSMFWNGTTDSYWDCECDDNYIHPKSEESCPVCGRHHSEQPDSIVGEVLTGIPLTHIVIHNGEWYVVADSGPDEMQAFETFDPHATYERFPLTEESWNWVNLKGNRYHIYLIEVVGDVAYLWTEDE